MYRNPRSLWRRGLSHQSHPNTAAATPIVLAWRARHERLHWRGDRWRHNPDRGRPQWCKSTVSDGNGNYAITGLPVAGFTARARAEFYNELLLPVTLTSNQLSVNFALQAVPLFDVSGRGDKVFDMPRTVKRVRISALYTLCCQNFIVRIDGRPVVNELLGTAFGKTGFDGTYVTGGGVTEIISSDGVLWHFQEVR